MKPVKMLKVLKIKKSVLKLMIFFANLKASVNFFK